ncbi:hypothetical protein MG293_011734 [Ovis ammon polii]|uniref:Uncharacterized protein n=1 Tax=Ovis ammon polii TaxID=230172 RepID=A0AAD4Y9I7_OVIAM|nr:hypothetical protein MG293_011734 [Ovis ammon polii]
MRPLYFQNRQDFTCRHHSCYPVFTSESKAPCSGQLLHLNCSFSTAWAPKYEQAFSGIILIHSEFSLFLKPGFGPDVRIPDLRSSPAVPEPFSSSPSSTLPLLSVTHAAITQHHSAPTRTRGLAPSRAELRACLLSPGRLGSAQAISKAVQGEEDKAAKQHFR